MKSLKKYFFTVTAIYLIIVMATFLLQEKLIFHPEELPQSFHFNLDNNTEEVFLKTSDGETINGLFFNNQSKETILYFHGNAGSLKDWQYVSTDFTSADYNLLIIDYRGYGKSSGSITEEGLYLDAEAALQYLTEKKNIDLGEIIIYGRSIGTGVATELATIHTTKGLILESPFSSLKKLANQKMPFLLPSLFLQFHFDSKNKMKDISCPILFIHGGSDSLIPSSHTEQLFSSFSGKKEKVIIPYGGHNDLSTFETYHSTIRETLPRFFH